MRTLKELVSDLPSQALDLFVMHYEAGEVGNYFDLGFPISRYSGSALGCRCPRASMGFPWPEDMGEPGLHAATHPALIIERMALGRRLDTATLYTECVLALTERDGAGLPEPEVTEAVR